MPEIDTARLLFDLFDFAVLARVVAAAMLWGRAKALQREIVIALAFSPPADIAAMQRAGKWAVTARRVGFVAGLSLAVAGVAVLGNRVAYAVPGIWAAGYLAGVLIGEREMPRRQWADATRHAGLAARRVGDYVSVRMRFAVLVAGGAGAAVVTVTMLMAAPGGTTLQRVCAGRLPDPAYANLIQPPDTAFLGSTAGTRNGLDLRTVAVAWPGWHYGLAALAVFAAAPVGTELVLRRIAERPRPARDEALARVDDALRTQSARRVVGAGLAACLLPTAAVIDQVASGLHDVCWFGVPAPSDPARYLTPVTIILVAAGLFFAFVYPALTRLRPAQSPAPETLQPAAP